jgi:hypothetical protein
MIGSWLHLYSFLWLQRAVEDLVRSLQCLLTDKEKIMESSPSFLHPPGMVEVKVQVEFKADNLQETEDVGLYELHVCFSLFYEARDYTDFAKLVQG